jgi:hypothetical protein
MDAERKGIKCKERRHARPRTPAATNAPMQDEVEGWKTVAPTAGPMALSLTAEFWSRRWNVGFSEMLALTVNSPIASRFGRKQRWQLGRGTLSRPLTRPLSRPGRRKNPCLFFVSGATPSRGR